MRECVQLLARARCSWRAAAAAWSGGGVQTSRPNDLTDVLERSSDCVVQCDASGAISYLNPAARALLGIWQGIPLDPMKIGSFAAAGTLRQLNNVVLPALKARGVWVGEIDLRLRPHHTVPFSLMALVHRGSDAGTLRFSAVLRDISDSVASRRQIQRQNEILTAITEAMPATVVIVDSQGRYRFVNSAFERQVRLSAAQILGRTAVDVLGPAEVERRRPYMRKAIAGEAVEFTLDYPGPHGTTYLALNCIPLNLHGRVDGFVGISRDITIQAREQLRLAQLAERDPLTGLLNRAGFEQRAANRPRPGDAFQALLYIDLDHFKPVNDRYGHQTGDRLLQLFAQRLKDTVRSSDVVARLGGDEFAILLNGDGTPEAADMVAAKILTAASAPFEIEGQRVHVTASIGVNVANRPDSGLHEWLARADAQLYLAKAAGRGRHFTTYEAISS
jgi:diguanylate cyclase (GGDEF)-like protein/PAS domain S-box-containing protein